MTRKDVTPALNFRPSCLPRLENLVIVVVDFCSIFFSLSISTG